MKIVIITDGNSEQGLGHVYQSKILAKYLLERVEHHPEITFLTKSDEGVAALIRNDGFAVERLKNDDEVFNFLQVIHPKMVIFDKIDVSPSLAKKIKSELDVKLVIFTNLTAANDYADISVVADMGSNFQNICERTGNRIKYRGPKYWVLRPEFYHQALSRKTSDKVCHITIIFGGADPQDYTTLVLEQLLKADDEFIITIILGAANRKESCIMEVQDKYQNSKSRVHVLRSVSNVAEIMSGSDLVFASPGLSLFEALKMGTPVLSFYQTDLQKTVYENYIPSYGKKDVERVIEFIHSGKFIFPESEFISGMEIGDGKDEIIDQILK